MVLFLQWEFSFSFISISSLSLCLCLCQCKWLWNDLDVWLERWFDLKEKDRNETWCCWKKGMIRVGMNRWDRHKNKRMMSGDGEKWRNEMIVIERMIDENEIEEWVFEEMRMKKQRDGWWEWWLLCCFDERMRMIIEMSGIEWVVFGTRDVGWLEWGGWFDDEMKEVFDLMWRWMEWCG